MTPAVVMEDVVKEYAGGVRALDGVNLEIAPGEAFGLLGPNGAGKTTTIRILVGLLRATSGSAWVSGHDVVAEGDRVRSLVGYAAQGAGLDLDLTVAENLRLRARLYGLSRRDARQRSEELCEAFGLSDLADRRAGFLSGGQRRRVDLALALVHEPPVLLLDEPTTGLDPQSRRALWEHVESLARSGTTLVLTTQYLEEADRLCNRVVIIDRGRLVAEGTTSALKAAVGEDVLSLVVSGAEERVLGKVGELVGEVTGSTPTIVGSRFTVPVKDPVRSVAAVLGRMAAEQIELESVSLSPPSLEDVYLHYTGTEVRREATARTGLSAVDVIALEGR
jgi:daunorubicin resistance ABC transporter ATP-binding subunit